MMARDEKKAESDLKEFLEKGAKGATVFFIYQTVIEYKEEKKPPPPPPPEGNEGDADNAPADDAEAAQPAEPEKPELVPVANEILSLVIGRPPDMKEEREKVKIAYFVLRADGPLSIVGKTVNDAMTEGLFFGTLNSRFLIDLKLLLHQVFLPSLAIEDPADGRKVKLEADEEGEAAEEGAEGVEAQEAPPPEEVEEAPDEEVKNIVNLPRHIHEEILGSTTKFLSHVKQAAVQVYVNVNIRIPAVDLEQLANAQNDVQLLTTLKQSVMEWSQ